MQRFRGMNRKQEMERIIMDTNTNTEVNVDTQGKDGVTTPEVDTTTNTTNVNTEETVTMSKTDYDRAIQSAEDRVRGKLSKEIKELQAKVQELSPVEKTQEQIDLEKRIAKLEESEKEVAAREKRLAFQENLSNIGKDFQRIIPHIKKCQGLVVENDRSQFKGNIEEKFKRQSYIKVSCNFHDTEQSKKALEFYKQYEGIEVTLFDGDLSEDERTLSYNGRAKNLIDHKTMWFNIRNRHCMATDRWEKLVEKTITVAANGNVFLGLDYEHTDVDEDNLGNVLNESIYDMAVRWNYQNPIMLDENNKMLEAKSYVFNYENGYSGVYMDMTEELYKLNKERVQVYDRLIEIRKHFHKMYKYLTIERILFLSDMFLELEMGGTYIKNYCDEDTVQTWDYERDKELIEVSVVCLPSINEDCFFERYEYLKPLKGKFPLVDMDIEDCDRLYHALEDYKSGAADKIRQSLTVFKGLKLKYGILDIDMEIKFDEDIEQALENSSALWKLGKSVIELLKRLE